MDLQFVEKAIVMEMIIKAMNIDYPEWDYPGRAQSEWQEKSWEREIGIHDNTRERTMPWGPIILEGVVSEKVGRNELKGKGGGRY